MGAGGRALRPEDVEWSASVPAGSVPLVWPRDPVRLQSSPVTWQQAASLDFVFLSPFVTVTAVSPLRACHHGPKSLPGLWEDVDHMVTSLSGSQGCSVRTYSQAGVSWATGHTGSLSPLTEPRSDHSPLPSTCLVLPPAGPPSLCPRAGHQLLPDCAAPDTRPCLWPAWPECSLSLPTGKDSPHSLPGASPARLWAPEHRWGCGEEGALC